METKNDARSVHCKVAYKGQFRRFPLSSGTEFSSLYLQVKNILALDKEFVLKYKDNEGDLITISSNEELVCAVFDGDVLRLTVDSVDELPKPDSMAVVDNSTEYPPYHGFGTSEFPGPHCPGRYFHGHGGRGGRRGCGRRWGQHHDGHSPCGGWRMKLTTKREIIQSKLAQLSEEKELSPEQQRKQACLQSKLQKIDSKLGKSESGYEKDWRTEKHWKKHGKHSGKHWKKHHRGSEKSEVFLSDEAQVEIAKLKSQIEVLLPPLKEVSSQLEAKKIALKNATIDVDTEKLLKEIADLKAVRKECKVQIKPLKQKVKELKKGC